MTLTSPEISTTPEARTQVRSRLRTLLLGTDVGEEVTPYEPVAPLSDPHVGRGPVRRNLLLVAATASGFAGALLIVATAPVWRLDLFSSRLVVPGVPHPGSSFFAGASFLTGVILMMLGWIGLIGRSERQRWSESKRLVMVAVVTAIWVVPFLFGPPLLSNDAYSYGAQGELSSQGFDPTSHGPVYLGSGDYMVSADPVWRNNPAPYGPVAIGASRLAVEVSGHDPSGTLVALRLFALVGVVMSAVGVALIARSYRFSPAAAVAIGIANPLVLLHLVGGAHNDALMLGFLALGLAAVRHDRRWLGVALIAAATAVKLPAAAGFVFVGWCWPVGDVRLRTRARYAATTFGAGAAVMALYSVVGGTGPSWITNLRNTGVVTTTFSATTKLGFVLSDTLHGIGLEVSESAVVASVRLLGLAVAGVLSLLILLRSPRIGMVRSVGLVLLLTIVLGPVVWPWYLPAGFALLAASGLGKYRPSYLVVTFAASLLVFPNSVESVPSLSRYQHFVGLGVVLLIVGAAYGAQRLTDWFNDRRVLQHEIDGSLPESHRRDLEDATA